MVANKEPIFKGMTKYKWFIFIVALLGWSMASMDLNLYSINLPLIMSTYHISIALTGIITALIFLGATIVVWIVGPFLDTYGRKSVWQYSLLTMAIFTGFTIFATTVVILIIIRVLSDGPSYIEFPTGITIANEEMPAKLRGSLYGWIQAGFPLGYFLATLIAITVVPRFPLDLGWKIAFLIGVVPILLVVIMRHWVKEPERSKIAIKARNLAKNGHLDEAKEITKKYQIDLSEAPKYPYKQLFTDPKLKKHTIYSTITELSHEFSTPALFFFTSTALVVYKHIPVEQSFYIILAGNGLAFFAYGLMGHLGQKITRKWASAIIGLVGGISVIFFALSSGLLETIIATLLFYPLVLAWNGTWWVYIAETYPTRVRGTADSWQVGLNDAAWILGSLAYGFVISAAGFLYTYLLIGALPVLLGAILVATKGIKVKPDEELEEII
ncbi:hypothetical protein SE19_08235, partial [Acidiplasma aeolicum]